MVRWLAVAIAWIVAAAPAAGAATWRGLVVPEASQVFTLVASPTVAGMAWASPDRHLQVTRDGGRSWAPSGETVVPVQDAIPARTWRLGGLGLECSDDGGTTWQAVPGLAQALAANPDNDGYSYGTGAQQLLSDPVRSGDLLRWSQLVPGLQVLDTWRGGA